MKDQYFGDVNDYRKYGLLRALTQQSPIKLGVSWILTPSDNRSDGNALAYLRQPSKYRRHDPELFDWLHHAVHVDKDRRTARISSSPMLGDSLYHSDILSDDHSGRHLYFAEMNRRLLDCDLIFFDPDNGLEVASKPIGRRESSKYLYWQEVESTFQSGSSILVYQHFARVSRDAFTGQLAQRLRTATGASAVFSFSTAHVVFFLASQPRHADFLRSRIESINSNWHGQIRSIEHSASEDRNLS